LGYLDSFGGTGALLEDYQQAYAQVSSLRREINKLQMDEAEKSRRIDSLNYQIRELERAKLVPGEDEELTERRNMMRSAGKISDAVVAACGAMLGAGEQEGAVSLISQAEGEMRAAARYGEQFTALAETLSQLRSLAEDAGEQVREILDDFDFTPEELDRIESRLDVLYRLKKKYGSTVEEMLEYLDKCKEELDEIQCSTDTIAQLNTRLEKAKQVALQKAQALSKERKAQAKLLQTRIQTELTQLDMPKVRFSVQFGTKDTAYGLDETGMDEVQFLMSANVGEDMKPIQKIASGGELARIMLALKNVLAENELVSTMVFDEVDTGVSGRAAQKVAQKMANVAKNKQVLCVTHLPQIAAMADTHFSVEKGEDGQRTYTVVTRLDRQKRREELARLTGGTEVTDHMLLSAEELLAGADRWKAQLGRTKPNTKG
jgi:DNA repair protein RecN (Recombination protein N)